MRDLITYVFRDRALFQASYFALHNRLRSSGPSSKKPRNGEYCAFHVAHNVPQVRNFLLIKANNVISSWKEEDSC